MEVKDIDKYCPRGISPNASNYITHPFNGTCLQKFFSQLQTSLRRFNQWEEILYTTVYIIISVAAVIGNGLVILAVVRKKSMRTNRNVLILNLALSNLILALTNIPFLWLPSIDFEFPYSRIFCKFANVLPGSNIYCSTLTISVMAIDRYYSVKKLKITSNRKQCFQAVGVSAVIWVVSFILSLPLLLYYETTMLYVMKEIKVMDPDGREVNRSYGWRQCRLMATESSLFNIETQSITLMMSVLQVVFLYVVPLFVLAIFNLKLTRFLKTNATKMSKVRTAPRREDPFTTIAIYAINSKFNYGKAWIDKEGEPHNIATYCDGCFLLDLDLLNTQANVGLVERIDQTCKMISMLSICVNPFLYGFLNTNFRHEFAEIYYRYIRCQTKSQTPSRLNNEFSSIAHNRQDSMYNDDNSLLPSRTSSATNPVISPREFNQKTTKTSFRTQSVKTKLIDDRVLLDEDVEKDSFV
ncbi:unnamed protein product [Caenorhabditis bovis]|uniref:G-protein coupled receptors family 1 profile domain-containing protein n=1 Tax=Caenorhabditis bovis TaxID=2654633 RepID=A0A8S1EJJ8_9PELO|nr:unnamed protein product [Caenorhabditis bovis]